MSSPGDLAVEPPDLLRAAEILEAAATSLTGAAPGLQQRPDAGASSDEVATALAALAQAVTGVAGHITSIAEVTRGSAADFSGTDHAVGQTWQQRRTGLAP